MIRENPKDGGAWWAAVYGVAHSRRRLKRLSSSSSSSLAPNIAGLRPSNTLLTFLTSVTQIPVESLQ